MGKWFIGIDDTDMPDSRGTGHLARALADALRARGLRTNGVTRHQLLVDPRIPYTSHNSANCLGVEADGAGEDEVFDWACRFVAERAAEGADPGVCLAASDAAGGQAAGFGRRAQSEVVTRIEAESTAAAAGCRLAGLGGTCDGIIGALAAVGLRAQGNDGRFVDLGGIRELPDRARVSEILRAGVVAVECGEGEAKPEDWVHTFGWARPRLVEGRAVLFLERSETDGRDWIVRDRRSRGGGHKH